MKIGSSDVLDAFRYKARHGVFEKPLNSTIKKIAQYYNMHPTSIEVMNEVLRRELERLETLLSQIDVRESSDCQCCVCEFIREKRKNSKSKSV